MSKRRLEEILKTAQVRVHMYKDTSVELPKEQFEYMYKQAERVHNLECELKETKQMLNDEIKYCRGLME